MNHYSEFIDFLFSLKRSEEMKPNLSNLLKIAEKLGHPERQFPSVHIAGTNGKGSVAFKMAEVLKNNGYRVGLFTSPHLFNYRERIQINGKMISEERVVQGLKTLLPLIDIPKFFEITTLLAFDYFAEEEVDIAIIEAGLGGRFDPTNILSPILTIITQIAKDHTEILGETLEKIAYEKGGIIKKGIPLILSEKVQYPSILKIAEEQDAPIIFAQDDSTSIARKGLKLLPFEINFEGGLKRRPPCRYQKEGNIIFDVAHNPAAFTRLFETIKKEYPSKKIHVLLGMAKDKDIKGSLEIIEQHADHIALLPIRHPRLLPPEDFPRGEIMSYEEALEYAKEKRALAIVTGSFHLMQMLQLPETSIQSP